MIASVVNPVYYEYPLPPPARFYVTIASVAYSGTIEAQPAVVTRGRVLNRVVLDREEMESYQLTLTAMDRSPAPLSASIPLVVTLLEVNDNTPLFSSPNFTFVLSENTTSFVQSFTVSCNILMNNIM